MHVDDHFQLSPSKRTICVLLQQICSINFFFKLKYKKKKKKKNNERKKKKKVG